MLSARSLFQEILDHDESYRLFCSIAASGEAQGGWENGRIAALVPEGLRELAPKIARHGADEDKHGRIFQGLLRKRSLKSAPVPAATDYTMLLERRGIGLTHDKLRRDQPLTERDIVVYLCHSRVTEQRAADQMDMLVRYFGDHPEVGKAIRMISHDEDNHLAYCHEELLRLARAGHGRFILRTLRESALAETAVYRDVSLAVLAHMGRILRWPKAKSALLAAGVHALYGYERAGGWRRMTELRMPERRDALGGPAEPEREPAHAPAY
ncbi:ferritin-like domain-containing protein [Streptomyces sp. NPDC046887]|uniref:ferritin-like domain-containing protein n=1 Tax=Streptomyces sp. NPDC046887 TaxID=3155472 RepID=UPI0033D11B74